LIQLEEKINFLNLIFFLKFNNWSMDVIYPQDNKFGPSAHKATVVCEPIEVDTSNKILRSQIIRTIPKIIFEFHDRIPLAW